MKRKSAPARTDEREIPEARDVLAPLYDEGEAGATGAAREFEAARDKIADWINEELTPESRAKLRNSLITPPEQDAEGRASVIPVTGAAWVRRPRARTLLPMTSILPLNKDSLVVVPSDSRAQVHFDDGSLLLLDGGTELRVGAGSGSRDRASLQRGRLFAWVAPQASGRFALGTPRGRVAVLGTEFDLTITPGDALRLLVAKGKVAFTSQSATASAMDTALSVGQLLNLSGDQIHVSKLSAGQLRREIEWAKASRPRRSGIGLYLGAFALLAVVASTLLYPRKPDTPQDFQAPPILPTQLAAPQISQSSDSNLLVSQPPARPGMSWRVTMSIEQKQGETWLPDAKMTVLSKVLEVAPDGRTKFEINLEKLLALGPDGKEVPPDSPRGSFQKLSGKSFQYWLGTDGRIQFVSDRKLLEAGPEFAYVMARFAGSESQHLLQNSGITPGQTWDRNTAGTLPQQPQASYDYRSRVRYDGLETVQGRELRRFSYGTAGQIKGLKLREFKRQNMTVIVELDSVVMRESGVIYVDPQTGNPVSMQSSEQRNTQTAQTTNVEGRPPIRRSAEPRIESVRTSAQVEYLP